MQVYHVVQNVSPGSVSSYKAGTHWLASFDCERDAQQKADEFNHYRSELCNFVAYSVIGPFDEQINFDEIITTTPPPPG